MTGLTGFLRYLKAPANLSVWWLTHSVSLYFYTVYSSRWLPQFKRNMTPTYQTLTNIGTSQDETHLRGKISVWIRKTNWMSLFVFFISLLIVAQHVSGNHVPIFRSWRLRDLIALCWYVPWLQEGGQVRLVGSASMDTSCSTCFRQPCAHHQELTTAWCYSLVLVCAVAAGRWSRPVGM